MQHHPQHRSKRKGKRTADQQRPSVKGKGKVVREDRSGLSAEECMTMMDRLIHKNQRISQELIREKSQLWREFTGTVHSHWTQLLHLLAEETHSGAQSEQSSIKSTASTQSISRVAQAASIVVECRVVCSKKQKDLLQEGIQAQRLRKAQIGGRKGRGSELGGCGQIQ